MKITDLKKYYNGNRTRVSAKVTWEECDLPEKEVFFETTEPYSDYLTCNPEAFLVGCLIPAFHHNEERIYIDGEVCPALKENLITVMTLLKHWYYEPGKKIIEIEAKTKSREYYNNLKRRAGFFFSGGVDSLANLWYNRLNYPLEHPLSLKDGIIIYGQNWESDDNPNTFEKAVKALTKIANDTKLTLLPVYTNIRDINKDSAFFKLQFHGAILAATSHAFAKRFHSVSISSTDDIPSLKLQNTIFFKPWGSHPLLDTHFSSSELRIRHDNLILSRIEKLRLISEWETGIKNIKVCQPNYPGDNCGLCEKCIRTELGLLAIDMLNKTDAFPLDDVTEDHINRIKLEPFTNSKWTCHHHYIELIPYLIEKNRNDLVNAVKKLIQRSNGTESKVMKRLKQIKRRVKLKIKDFDRIYLNESLIKIKHKFIN